MCTRLFRYSNSLSRPYLRWLVFGSSTYEKVRLVASILAALISSLIWNWNYIPKRFR